MKAAATAPAWRVDFFTLAAIWGSSFLFMRLALVDLGVWPTAGLRVGIAAAFLLPIVALRGHWPALKRHWRGVFAMGLLNSAVPFACFLYALQSLSTGLSAILNATVPLFGAVVAWLWLGAGLSRLKIAGLLIGFGGVTALAMGKASFTPDASGLSSGLAVLACLLACVCYGISASATRKYLMDVPALVTAAGSQLGAALALAVPAALFWPTHSPGVQTWLALTILGVVCSGIAYVLYFRLLQRAGATRTLAVTFMVPVFAVLYGGLFLQETVSLRMVVCGVVIALGTALSTGLVSWPSKAPVGVKPD